jgi:hypothetical protein
VASRLGVDYRGYTLDDSEDMVRTRYRERFDREPQEIFRSGPVWLAGPVDREEQIDEKECGSAKIHRGRCITAV